MATVDHFAHLETNGVVVDLFWNRDCLDACRVEVVNEREGSRLVLNRLPGEAIEAFYHPFSAARAALNGQRVDGVIGAQGQE